MTMTMMMMLVVVVIAFADMCRDIFQKKNSESHWLGYIRLQSNPIKKITNKGIKSTAKNRCSGRGRKIKYKIKCSRWSIWILAAFNCGQIQFYSNFYCVSLISPRIVQFLSNMQGFFGEKNGLSAKKNSAFSWTLSLGLGGYIQTAKPSPLGGALYLGERVVFQVLCIGGWGAQEPDVSEQDSVICTMLNIINVFKYMIPRCNHVVCICWSKQFFFSFLNWGWKDWHYDLYESFDDNLWTKAYFFHVIYLIM